MDRRTFLKSLIAIGVGAILPITSTVTFYDVMVRTNDRKVQGCVAALLESNPILSDLPWKSSDGTE